MAVKTSSTAQLAFSASDNGTYAVIGKVRDVTLNVNRDALETTSLGDADRTYAYGIRSTSGSGSLLYDSADAATKSIMDQILSTSAALSGIQLKLDTGASTGVITGSALITATGASVSVGDLITVPISFTISGATTGSF